MLQTRSHLNSNCIAKPQAVSAYWLTISISNDRSGFEPMSGVLLT